MGYIQRLAGIAEKINDDDYCIRDDHNSVIAGDAAGCTFYIRPHKSGGWQVFCQEPARGTIYEDYHLATEREACVKFIEMTEDYYHLGKYLGEFKEDKLEDGKR